MKKSRTKTRDRTPKGVPRGTVLVQPNGSKLVVGAGRGPKKGAPNAGRPPDAWKQSLRELADREAVRAHVDAALLAGPRRPLLDDKGYPVDREGKRLKDEGDTVYIGSTFFEAALDYATDHGYGKAAQPVGLSGTITLESLLAAVKASE